MLLNNYFILRSYTDNNNPVGSNYNANLGITRYDGNTTIQYFWKNSNISYVSYPAANHCLHINNGVVIGTGDTPEDISDYCLDNDISSIITSTSYTVGGDGTQLKSIFTVSGTNTTGDDVVIKEIGIYKLLYDGNMYTHTVLLIRKVLDTPITVLNGATFTFPVEWTEGEEE